MKEQISYSIISCILAKLTASSSPAEDQLLEEWLQESEAHHILFDQLAQKENFEQYQIMYEEHNAQIRYLQHQQSLKREKRIRLFKRLGYAAILLLPLTFAALLWLGRTEQTRSIVPLPSPTIRPGSSYAILTLPGGTTIQLDSTTRQSQVFQAGIISLKDTLEYQGTTITNGEYHTLSIPRGGEYVLKLSDGTKVWLNAETELRYPVNFDSTQRRVFLKGEAYFEVAKNESSPFIIITDEQTTTVLGTSFNLRAYPEENQIQTTLERGSVKITTPRHSIILKPGEQSRTHPITQQIEIMAVNTQIHTAWHIGKFIFIDQCLEDILNTLSRWYNMDVLYTQPDLKKLQFTGELKKYEDIQDFLEKIEHLEKVRFQIQNQTVTVSKY